MGVDMQAFVENAVKVGVIEPLRQTAAAADVDAVHHPWYDNGVVFDWSRQRLVATAGATLFDLPSVKSSVRGFFQAISDAAVERQAFLTVLEVSNPMNLVPLVQQAQDLSRFVISTAACEGQWYKFVKGSAGQRSARDASGRLIDSIAAQLKASGLRVVVFFSSIAILTLSGFDDALRNTGAVYRALTAQKVAIAAPLSMLDPRRPHYFSDTYSTTLSPVIFSRGGGDGGDRLVRIAVEAFSQLLQDKYEWLLEGFVQANESVVRRAFDVFAEGLWKHLDVVVGSSQGALDEVASDVKSAADLCSAARPSLVAKGSIAPRPGEAALWCVFELRLLLLRIDAYSLNLG